MLKALDCMLRMVSLEIVTILDDGVNPIYFCIILMSYSIIYVTILLCF